MLLLLDKTHGIAISDHNPSGELLAPALIDWSSEWDSSGVVPEGVTLSCSDDPSPLLPLLDYLRLICVFFDDHNDGRGFTLARRLREAGYTGELRATGHYLQDQLHYLKRCGFDAFDVKNELTDAAATRSLETFTVRYQALLDEAAPALMNPR